jgi:ribosomal protein S18 acetylase RimI-like enzyme
MHLIRPYQPSDWPRLCEIHDAARMIELAQSAGEEAFLDLETTAGPEGLFDGEVAVLEDSSGTVQGFAAWLPDELTWLYVHPSAHGLGYGRALLRHALSSATGPMVDTQVLEGNAAATALYLAEGFVVRERKTGRLSGNESFSATGLLLQWARSG